MKPTLAKGKSYNKLGPQVKISNKKLQNDDWAQKMLREIGSVQAEEGFKYLGSAAMHFYSAGDSIVAIKKEGAIKHQIALGDIAEEFAQVGVTEFTRAIMRFYGHTRKQIDPNYKVQE